MGADDVSVRSHSNFRTIFQLVILPWFLVPDRAFFIVVLPVWGELLY